MIISAVLILLVLTACASHTLTAKEQAEKEYRREVARIETIEEFRRRERACALSGGVLQVNRRSTGRLRPTFEELKMAICSRTGRPAGLF